MVSRYIGGVLLVAGTTIGGGMLALPVLTCFVGLVPSMVVFFLCWLVMLATAFFFLDVNLALQGTSHLISMAEKRLGGWGKRLSWVFYLLLLYSLIAAYIAGSAPLFIATIKEITGYVLPTSIVCFALPILFGFFIYVGIVGVDLINRFLMVGLFLSYLIVIGFLPSQITGELLNHLDWKPTFILFPVVITSFGYHIIIPSLVQYIDYNRKRLRSILAIGSLIPLVIYSIWQGLILRAIPLFGDVSLIHAWHKGISATACLSDLIHNKWIGIGSHLFSFFAIVTSFLGVSLSLADFLIDGLKIKRNGKGKLLVSLLTFIPPLIFVLSCRRWFFLWLLNMQGFLSQSC